MCNVWIGLLLFIAVASNAALYFMWERQKIERRFTIKRFEAMERLVGMALESNDAQIKRVEDMIKREEQDTDQ